MWPDHDNTIPAVVTGDGDPKQLEALRAIFDIALRESIPLGIRLAKFNPSQTQNEQDSDGGKQFPDLKSNVGSTEACDAVAISQHKIERITAQITSQVGGLLEMTKEETRIFAEVVVRSNYAHEKSVTEATCRQSCDTVGHVPAF